MGRSLPAVGPVTAGESRFRQAAWTYLGYGIVYWFTALYLQLAVFPVRSAPLFWFGAGGLLAVGVPWLLYRPRRWFERWVLSRRARLALVGAESMRMPGFGGGVPPSPAGAWPMALVAAVTAAMLARAAWQGEPSAAAVRGER